ncbi:MAG TPA: zinc-dependent metalloprotease [Nocardioidaceae bacterium]|nr:zinc-dependent metalloprotease [Nocardioidaceae bacterium]
MAQQPSDNPGDDPEKRPQNPFAGTPFEQMFAAFGGGGTPGQGGPDLSALMQQVQRMFTPYEGTVNWTLAKDTARSTVAQSTDPSPTQSDQGAVDAAVRLAELWLDPVCGFDATGARTAAWSRAEWVEATMDSWQQMVEPMAGQMTTAMQRALPDEAQAMAGPIMGMLTQAGGSMFGAQVGQGVAALAAEVLSSTDIGIPLTDGTVTALVTANVSAFSEGLDVEQSDVMIYLALRECAHQRLFGHVPWLRSHLLSAVEDYGRGLTIDTGRIEEAMSSMDPGNLEAMQEMMSGGLFVPEETETQRAALQRLEAALALVEGWVDDVVGQATHNRMPAAGRLQEAVRRRRAAGGPAEQTFASLVGLELRPRRLRDAATLWGALRSAKGQEARDAVWAHPDLLPTAADLDDPIGFSADDATAESPATDAEFDAALAELLDSAGRDADGEAPGDETPGDGDERR